MTLLVGWTVLWRIGSLRVLIPGRTAVNGESVGGLVLLFTLNRKSTFLGMTLLEWSDSSACFWCHICVWITRFCKYFSCGKLRAQTLDYHCCCVTLAASSLCSFLAFSVPSLAYFLSFLSIVCLAWLFACLLLHNRSLFLCVCPLRFFLPLPPSWCSRWHLRQAVLCQTAIPQIEISWVLKSLRQIYYLNGAELRGAGRRLLQDVGSGWHFDSLISDFSRMGCAEMDR